MKSSMKINESTYDTDISVDLQNFDFDFKLQYLNDENDLKMKLVSFVEKFDFIDVKIPDSRLQEIWNLVMTTEMMQDFLIEDIFHHYFIKNLPVFDLIDLVSIPLNGKTYSLSFPEIPVVSIDEYKQYFEATVGIREVAEPSKFHVNLEQLGLNPKELLSKAIRQPTLKKSEDNGLAEDETQNVRLIIDASFLSMMASDMMGPLELDLSSIEKVRSFLTLSNLRLVFPSLADFYPKNDDVINTNLSFNVQSKFS